MFADAIKGYGNKRFIEVFWRVMKNNSYGYCSSKPAPTIEIFGGGVGDYPLCNQGRAKQQ